MSEEKIRLPDFLIAEMYKESLVDLDTFILGKERANKEEDILPGVELVEPTGTIPFLGENRRNVTIIVDEPAAQFLSSDDLAFLTTILKACQLALPDIAIVNMANEKTNYERLKQQLKPATILLFDVDPSTIQLPFLVPPFQLQKFDGATIILAPPLDPSIAAIHYGQAIFEGIKAYKDGEGNAYIFRPHENLKRFNISAARLRMPAVPEEIFIEGMRTLVNIDKKWIPEQPDHSLYIRPFMFSTDAALGVKPSDKYKFLIILSPTGPYYSKPMRIYVEQKYTRAAPGGIGYAKAAGNYATSLLPAEEAKKLGYDQVLWTDAAEHKYVQEIGTMNVFFIMGNKAYTPGLEAGTILAGITRDSVITILKEMGIEVIEKEISIDEITDAHRRGELAEVFGTGTAATISPIQELRYKDYVMQFDLDTWKISPEIKKRLDDIRNCVADDRYGWMYKI